MSNIDVKFLNKVYYGEFEEDLRAFEQILLSNDVFK
jgi:hypothetical protein